MTCTQCHARQPAAWKTGDACNACGVVFAAEVLCAACGVRTPEGNFCRACGAEMVTPQQFGAARMMRAAGVDAFSLKSRVEALAPEQRHILQSRFEVQLARVMQLVAEREELQSALGVSLDVSAFEDALVLAIPNAVDTVFEHDTWRAVVAALNGDDSQLDQVRSVHEDDPAWPAAQCALVLLGTRSLPRARMQQGRDLVPMLEQLRTHNVLGPYASYALGDPEPGLLSSVPLLRARCVEQKLIAQARTGDGSLIPHFSANASLILQHLPQPAPDTWWPALLSHLPHADEDDRERICWRIGGISELTIPITVAVEHRDGRMFNALLACEPHLDARELLRAALRHDMLGVGWVQQAFNSARERLGDLTPFFTLAKHPDSYTALAQLARHLDDQPESLVDAGIRLALSPIAPRAQLAVWLNERKLTLADVTRAFGSARAACDALLSTFADATAMHEVCFYDWIASLLDSFTPDFVADREARYIEAAMALFLDDSIWAILRGTLAKSLFFLGTPAVIEATKPYSDKEYWLRRLHGLPH